MFELAGDLGFLDEADFLAGIGLVEQVLDGDFPANVAVHGSEHCAHAAPGNFALDEVALLLAPPGEEFLHRLLTRLASAAEIPA